MTSTLLITVGSFGAAISAYFGNRLLCAKFGRKVASALVPWWEEACKMSVVLLVPGNPLLGVHLIFGGLEWAYDLLQGREEGHLLGWLAWSGHLITGAVAALGVTYGAKLWAAYLLASATHWLFQFTVLQVVFLVRSSKPTPQVSRR